MTTRQLQLILPKAVDLAPTPAKQTALLPKINLLAPLLPNPSKSLFQNEVEHRYFETFCSKTSLEILPSFNSGTLRQLLLQTCVSEPSIHHAVTALGALDKTNEDFEPLGSQCVVGSLPVDEGRRNPAQHHQNALKLYATAIKLMRESASGGKQSIRTTLLTCLVIFCFEAWTGLKELAVQQVQTGLKLIHSWREEQADEDQLMETSSKSTDAIEADLIRAFSRLDVQAISFASPGKCPLEGRAIATRQEGAILNRMPQVFSSVQEAELYESIILRRTMRFLSFEVSLPKPPSPLIMLPIHGWFGEKSCQAIAIQQNIIKDIPRWEAAFKPLWWRLKAQNDPSLMIAAWLSMHMKTALLSLTIPVIEDESKYDDYHDVFVESVKLAEYTLNCLNVAKAAAKSSSPMFQFDAHLVIPLHIVGHKCRDPVLRRRALFLMLSNRRREGVWDSTLAGTCATWAMEIEEKYLEDGKVPAWARIHGVVLSRDKRPRWYHLTCEQRLGPLSEDIVTRRKTVSW